MLESVQSVGQRYPYELRLLEWVFTILFSIEYLLRLLCVRRPLRYAFSFYGVIDLLAILPTYVAVFVPESQAHHLLVIRGFRILRVFRLFKLAHFVKQENVLRSALRASRFKIIVFLVAVLNLALFFGAVMYLIEGPDYGFTSIPRSMYWAIVTMTTVGYGDISPGTNLGQFFAAVVMILGYAIIAVPTGIVSVELAQATQSAGVTTQSCPSCSREGHDHDAKFCKFCGERI